MISILASIFILLEKIKIINSNIEKLIKLEEERSNFIKCQTIETSEIKCDSVLKVEAPQISFSGKVNTDKLKTNILNSDQLKCDEINFFKEIKTANITTDSLSTQSFNVDGFCDKTKNISDSVTNDISEISDDIFCNKNKTKKSKLKDKLKRVNKRTSSKDLNNENSMFDLIK